MIDFEIGKMRSMAKMLAPSADFDGKYSFYYDETNNIRKFYVREDDFNYSFSANFVLGGIVHEGAQPDIKPLFTGLSLQKNIPEVKLRHIAKGDFLECLTSDKLHYFLSYIYNSDLYIHYSSLNFLYWSIVDIVDSAIINSKAGSQLDPWFALHLKNDLYKLAKLEIDSVIDLFYKFKYPNIQKEAIIPFIEELTSLFDEYIDSEEFHFGLESMRQMLKESKREGSLPFVMDEEDHILINNLSQFYFRPIYMFMNSTHTFDDEVTISTIMSEYKILSHDVEIKNYSFVDSETNLLIQASDIIVGLLGKLTNYINTSSRNKIFIDLKNLSNKQKENIDLLLSIVAKSNSKNIGFLHSTDSFEEMEKMNLIFEIRSS